MSKDGGHKSEERETESAMPIVDQPRYVALPTTPGSSEACRVDAGDAAMDALDDVIICATERPENVDSFAGLNLNSPESVYISPSGDPPKHRFVDPALTSPTSKSSSKVTQSIFGNRRRKAPPPPPPLPLRKGKEFLALERKFGPFEEMLARASDAKHVRFPRMKKVTKVNKDSPHTLPNRRPSKSWFLELGRGWEASVCYSWHSYHEADLGGSVAFDGVVTFDLKLINC